GVRVAVQGLGNVGSNLVKYLTEEGAVVTIADIDQEKVKVVAETYNCEIVGPDQIAEVECDVYAPNALGATINDQSIPKLKCKIVAGGANNQLAETRHGDALREMGILYAPDFVANAGGLMNVFAELEGYSVERALERTTSVYDNMMNIFALAKENNTSTVNAAYKFAEQRLETLGRLKIRQKCHASRPFTILTEVYNR
ncbi:MAG: leucine dehydrogenase, partial [Bdellovibrionales bacterium]|nr:Glu/Leu/Phe/Val dehydrogenase family protein [Bdellovibrionales bacterium]NQZ18482.1 leucine dehydrogenase [Bdellovibrionales bacterium]